jgi:hypothetical protein
MIGQVSGQDQRREDDVADPLDGRTQHSLAEAVTEHQPAGIHVLDVDLGQRLLEMRGDVDDAHAGQLAIQQLAQRHAATAALAQRHDDLVDVVLQRGLGEVGRR